MLYKKCLLVRLPYGHKEHAVASIPVGLGYISEALYRDGVECELLDMAFKDQGLKGYDVNDLINKIQKFNPDVVGFSLMTLKHKFHYEIIGKVKKIFPDLTIVAGGPHLSTLREKVLEDCLNIDYGFVLEGDESFPSFCRGERIENIKGVLYRSNGKVIYTGDAEFIKDLDNLSFPRYRNFELEKYLEKTIYITTSRGCPHQCTYCPVKLSIGRKFRFVSAHCLVDEIVYWYKNGYRNFVMWDDNFTYIKKRVLTFCDEIEKKQISDANFSIPNGIRADKVDREMLERMQRIGFSHISIGVESASNRVLKMLKKGETVEQIEQAIKTATELGYKVFLYYILGSPEETIEDVKKSFELALKYPVAEARFYKLIPFPGTELFEWVKERNLFVRPSEEYLNDADHFNETPCFVTKELSYEDRIKIYREGQKISKQIKINWNAKKMTKLGVLGKIIAHLSQSEIFIKSLRKISVVRYLVEKTRPLILTNK